MNEKKGWNRISFRRKNLNIQFQLDQILNALKLSNLYTKIY